MNGDRAARAVVNHCQTNLGAIDAEPIVTTPWASATFDGAQSTVAFTTGHRDPGPCLRDLPEVDFVLGNCFVADIRVVACTRRSPGWHVVLEVLTIDAHAA